MGIKYAAAIAAGIMVSAWAATGCILAKLEEGTWTQTN